MSGPATNLIDLLFILLCGTIVMLSQSIQLKGVEATPAQVGGGAVSDIHADDVKIVAVSLKTLAMEHQTFNSVPELSAKLTPKDVVVLVPGDEKVSHHRMMQLWSALQEKGHRVQLGVRPVKS